MKLQQKIILISFIVVVAIGSLLALADSSTSKTSDFLTYVGVVGFFAGILQVLVGLLLLFRTDKTWGQSFLLSGGLIMVIGFATCTANFNLRI